MYKQSGTLLKTLAKKDIKSWLNTFDTVLADCDGVLWLYMNVFEGAPKVINQFKEMGKKVFFVTNNSTKTRAEFVEKAVSMRFNMTEEGIVSTAYLAAQYLKNLKFDRKVYVIGSMGIAQELDAVGIKNFGVGPDILTNNVQHFIHSEFKKDPEVGAVIVGFDEHFSFPKMIRASSYLNNPDCIFVSTNTDERFPMPNHVVPGTGAIVRSIEISAERKSISMGKPNPYMCDILISEHKILPERTLMIGDRCNTDILLGTNCGFQTLLVETGIHKESDVRQWQASDNEEDKKLIPDLITSELADLLEFMD